MARSYAASTSSACSSTCVYNISISSWRCWFSRSSSLSRRWSMAFSVKRCCTCFVSCSSPSLRRLAEDGDRSAETSRSTEDAASLRSSVFARYSFATSLFSTLITPMRGASCGRISSFITSQHRLNTSLLSSKSHRMFCLYFVCISSALYGVFAVGTRSTWIWSLGMTNWYAVPNSPVAATNRARLASTSSVPNRLMPSPLDMT
mmetsp:Transcript_14172/g.61723  ORF Transcript_14172/g.61723 Transcript_14172/m.61723 type:complete len:204 (+) Transcript_14172:1726-2337(+)